MKSHGKSHAKITNPPEFHNVKASPQLGSQTNPSLKKKYSWEDEETLFFTH